MCDGLCVPVILQLSMLALPPAGGSGPSAAGSSRGNAQLALLQQSGSEDSDHDMLDLYTPPAGIVDMTRAFMQQQLLTQQRAMQQQFQQQQQQSQHALQSLILGGFQHALGNGSRRGSPAPRNSNTNFGVGLGGLGRFSLQ